MGKNSEYISQLRGIIEQLAEAYPNCFCVYEPRRRPLAVGIRHQINLPGVTVEDVGRAVGHYARSWGYARSCVVGAARIALDGSVAGHVTEDEAVHAAGKLAAIRERRQQKRQAKKTPTAAPAADSPPSPPAAPKRLGLEDLRAAAARRRSAA